MNISSSNYNNRYDQYNNSQTSSVQGQNKVHHRKYSQETDLVQQSSDNTTQSTSSKKRANPLESLVEAGTITSDQGKAISDAFESSIMAFQIQSGVSTTFENPLDKLVTDGTITKDQQSSIKSALDASRNLQIMPQTRMMPPQAQQSGNTDPMSSTLGSLVTEGTITSDQESKIVSSIQSAFEASKTSMDNESDPLDSLVTAGTITKDQQNAVKSAFETAIKAYEAQSYSYEDEISNSFDKDF